MTLDQYLRLVDWTGSQLRPGKAGRIPPELDPILQRLDCVSGVWLDLVRNFRRRFRTEAGRADRVHQAFLARRRRQRIQPPPRTRRPS